VANLHGAKFEWARVGRRLCAACARDSLRAVRAPSSNAHWQPKGRTRAPFSACSARTESGRLIKMQK